MSNSPHQSLSLGSNPPTPPKQRHSLWGNGAVSAETEVAAILPFPPAPPPLPCSECLRVGGVGRLLPDDNDW